MCCMFCDFRNLFVRKKINLSLFNITPVHSLGAIATELRESLLWSCGTRPRLPTALNPIRVIVIVCVTSS